LDATLQLCFCGYDLHSFFVVLTGDFSKIPQNYKKKSNIKSFFEKKFAKIVFFLYLCPKLANMASFFDKMFGNMPR